MYQRLKCLLMEADFNTTNQCGEGSRQMWTLAPSSSPKSGEELQDQRAGAESGSGLIRCWLIASWWYTQRSCGRKVGQQLGPTDRLSDFSHRRQTRRQTSSTTQSHLLLWETEPFRKWPGRFVACVRGDLKEHSPLSVAILLKVWSFCDAISTPV